MKIIPLNSHVPNAKMKAFHVDLCNGHRFTFIAQEDMTIDQVRDAMYERWPNLKPKGKQYDNN